VVEAVTESLGKSLNRRLSALPVGDALVLQSQSIVRGEDCCHTNDVFDVLDWFDEESTLFGLLLVQLLHHLELSL